MAYTAPTAADLKLRFPAFSAVADETVEYWLEDARLIVTDSWIEADRAPAEMALAAHNMEENGLSSAGGAVANLAGMGVESFKSASFSVNFKAGAGASGGGYASSRYGKAFLAFLRRNRGGPLLVAPILSPDCC
jgi:uncharacterized protein YfiM (DUF2279 family)